MIVPLVCLLSESCIRECLALITFEESFERKSEDSVGKEDLQSFDREFISDFEDDAESFVGFGKA